MTDIKTFLAERRGLVEAKMAPRSKNLLLHVAEGPVDMHPRESFSFSRRGRQLKGASTMSVDKLEKDGYIEVEKKGEYRWRLTITPKGKSKAEELGGGGAKTSGSKRFVVKIKRSGERSEQYVKKYKRGWGARGAKLSLERREARTFPKSQADTVAGELKKATDPVTKKPKFDSVEILPA